MSRQEATEQYKSALKQGQKYYRAAVNRGDYPYPVVLDEILNESMVAAHVDLGVIEIPMAQIVGTKTAGRRAAMSGNFMPLLPDTSEFADKWITLCEAQLDGIGIRNPISCFEYMGSFYVQEGNKRVSVLKSFHAPLIAARVVRLVPAYAEEPSIQAYYEFMNFYRLSGLYQVSFRRPGRYAKLQAALGFDPEHIWTAEERKSFLAGYTQFCKAFEKLSEDKPDLQAADALLAWLQVFSFAQIKELSAAELVKKLSSLWGDVKNDAAEQPIAVCTTPDSREKSIVSKLINVALPEHINVAFLYAYDPDKSAWTRAHVHGQHYLERVLGDKVTVKAYWALDHDYDRAMEQAVAEKAKVIFATTPRMIAACRRIAALHSEVKVLNCSLSQPYTGVRTYYCRNYESKFIAGAIAGAMAEQDTIGYIANYPIVGVPASINAFALGAGLTNPRARIKLLWSCTDEDPLMTLIEQGVTVLSNRDATNSNHAHWALEWGTYKLQQDGEMLPLAVPCWDWGKLYERVIQSIFNGAWDTPGGKGTEKAINYWWGMNSGAIDIQLSEYMPQGMLRLAEILKRGLIDGTLDPFRGRINDQAGVRRHDGSRPLSPEEIINMDWLCDNVDGHIPAYEELRPEALETVRILGLHRDAIPPVKEETQL